MGLRCSGYIEDPNCPLNEEFKTRKALGQSLYSIDCPEDCSLIAKIKLPGGDFAVMKPHELHGPSEKHFCKGMSQFCEEKGSNPECIREWMDDLSDGARCKAIGCKYLATQVPCPSTCRASEI